MSFQLYHVFYPRQYLTLMLLYFDGPLMPLKCLALKADDRNLGLGLFRCSPDLEVVVALKRPSRDVNTRKLRKLDSHDTI